MSEKTAEKKKKVSVWVWVFLAFVIFYMLFTHNIATGDGFTVIAKRAPSFEYTFTNVEDIVESYNALNIYSKMNSGDTLNYLVIRLEQKGIIGRGGGR